MTFQQAPVNVPIQQRTRNLIVATGRKRVYGEHTALVTPRQTWFYRVQQKDLILVVPFEPETTLSGDGWELSQMAFYPSPTE
jgi:hypothetical protein